MDLSHLCENFQTKIAKWQFVLKPHIFILSRANRQSDAFVKDCFFLV
jgi:hypothetical protein